MLLKLRRTLFKVGGITLVVSAGQGIYIRNHYKQGNYPKGPFSGREFVETDTDNRFKQEKISNELSNIWNSSSKIIKDIKIYLPSTESSRRKIKLLLLGDSLVCGIGCERELVLPRVIAKTLSLALCAEVSWRAQGINGGTSAQLCGLLPEVADDLRSSGSVGEEVIVIVICGLNDWKSVLLQFPFGSGPIQFRNNLNNLLAEIRHISEGNCRIYLPALPLVCQAQDSRASLQTRPLKYFVEFMSRTWDQQKKELAESSGDGITYIDEPDVTAKYATPGDGNVCIDGVHPSSQGYRWWALHICDSILLSLKN